MTDSSTLRYVLTHKTEADAPPEKRTKAIDQETPIGDQADNMSITKIVSEENGGGSIDPLTNASDHLNFEKAVTDSALSFVTKLYTIDTMSRKHVQYVVETVRKQLNGQVLNILEKNGY